MVKQKTRLLYFTLRYAPGFDEAHVTIGLMMTALEVLDFGEASFLTDWSPVLRLNPEADLEFLNSFAKDLSQRIRDRNQREQMLQQMKESFSNLVRVSEEGECLSADPASEVRTLCRLHLGHEGAST
jgi:hypothetical protein